MCVPLIVQSKMSLAESFVTGHSELEQQLVILLDSWCHPTFSVEEISKYVGCVSVGVNAGISLNCRIFTVYNCVCFLRRFPRLSLSKHYMAQIQPKMLTKHILRLVEKFNINQGVLLYLCICSHFMYFIICLCAEIIMILHFWHRAMSQCSAQKETGFFTFPYV